MCMDSNTIRMTPVTEILQNITYSCDFGAVSDYDDLTDFWTVWLRDKCADTGFGHLIDSILANGFQGAASWCPDDGSVNEGHHRIAAAILLGMDEIPTTCWAQDWNPGGHRLSAHYNEDPNGIRLEL